MRLLTKAIAFAVPIFVAGTAHAADLCRYRPFIPSGLVPFEQSAAGFDQLGCMAQPNDSAHTRAWTCGSGADAVEVSLVRIVDNNQNMTVILFAGQSITSLAGFLSCPEEPRPFYRRPAADSTPFEPGSILVQDVFALGRYGDKQVTFLGISGPGVIVAGYPSSAIALSGRATPVTLAEGGLFGVTRAVYSTTSVEIAGRNLYSTPAPDIIAALQSRGSTITGTRDVEGALRTTVLSPPTGLEGVTRIELQALNRHTLQVTYNLAGEPQYMTYAGLLDGRYGRSTARAGTGATNRTCRYRNWESGAIRIIGEYCPDTGYVIVFHNSVTQGQLTAAARHRPTQSTRPRIDPDNL